MKNYDAVVIGSGISGLFATSKLVENKKKVLLIEQHDKVGGYTSFFTRNGFRFEASLHALNGLTNKNSDEFKMFQEFGLSDKLTLIDLVQLCHAIGDDFNLTITADVDKSLEELIKTCPDQEQEIKNIFTLILKIADQVDSFKNLKPKDFINVPMLIFKHKDLILNLRSSLITFLDKHTKSNTLKKILCAEVMYYHTNPDTYSIIHFAAAKASFLRGGASHIVGGSYALASALEEYIVEHGGEIILNSTVEKINLDANKVKSVSYKVKNDEEIKEVTSTVVLSAVAYPQLEKLLGPKNFKMLPARYNTFKHSSSVYQVYFGLKKPLSSIGMTNYSTMIFPDTYKKISDMHSCVNPINYGEAVQYLTNYSSLNIFPDQGNEPTLCCTVVDYGKNWDSLTKEEYNLKKRKHADEIIESLDKRYSGFKENIEYTNIATPKTFERYTLNPGGAIYGFAQNINQIGPFRPKHKTKIKGLYVAGAWTTPSGGVMPSAKSGYASANEVLGYLNKISPVELEP